LEGLYCEIGLFSGKGDGREAQQISGRTDHTHPKGHRAGLIAAELRRGAVSEATL
jgi:hypothetical protein